MFTTGSGLRNYSWHVLGSYVRCWRSTLGLPRHPKQCLVHCTLTPALGICISDHDLTANVSFTQALLDTCSTLLSPPPSQVDPLHCLPLDLPNKATSQCLDRGTMPSWSCPICTGPRDCKQVLVTARPVGYGQGGSQIPAKQMGGSLHPRTNSRALPPASQSAGKTSHLTETSVQSWFSCCPHAPTDPGP